MYTTNCYYWFIGLWYITHNLYPGNISSNSSNFRKFLFLLYSNWWLQTGSIYQLHWYMIYTLIIIYHYVCSRQFIIIGWKQIILIVKMFSQYHMTVRGFTYGLYIWSFVMIKVMCPNDHNQSRSVHGKLFFKILLKIQNSLQNI